MRINKTLLTFESQGNLANERGFGAGFGLGDGHGTSYDFEEVKR